jgi:hypothetical protein
LLQVTANQGTGGAFVTFSNSGGTPGGITAASQPTGISASTALGGSGTAFKTLPPTITCNYIMRVL